MKISSSVAIFMIALLMIFVPTLEARLLRDGGDGDLLRKHGIVLGAVLPRGIAPPSAPSGGINGGVMRPKAERKAGSPPAPGRPVRELGSVPSPGMGH